MGYPTSPLWNCFAVLEFGHKFGEEKERKKERATSLAKRERDRIRKWVTSLAMREKETKTERTTSLAKRERNKEGKGKWITRNYI